MVYSVMSSVKEVLELMKKAHAGSACAALTDWLCAESNAVLQAVASVDMFD